VAAAAVVCYTALLAHLHPVADLLVLLPYVY
jgi:hypothetical protein